MKRKGTSFWQRMALGVVCVLIVGYTFYHLIGLFDADVETYAAGKTTETTTLNYSGYLFRDETVLTSPYTGAVDYQVEDGVKVHEGQKLASVYADGDVSTREAIQRIDRQIAVLEESLKSSATIVDMGSLKTSLKDEYTAIMKSLAEGSASGLSEKFQSFLADLNRVDVLQNKDSAQGYAVLEHLYETRQSVMNSAGDCKTYYARTSGYFYTSTDGLEEWFTLDAVSEENFTAESFFELTAKLEQSSETENSAFGKICRSNEWKLVLPISVEDSRYFEVGVTYSGLFGGTSEATIPLTLEQVAEAANEGLTLLVFSADRMPSGFSFDRCQNVSIEVEQISGIYIPQDIVVRYGGGKGVYILRGSVVHFRYVEILYTGSDYYLVKADLEDDEHGRKFLQVNDIIILNGKNLFEGRVMD